MAAKAPEEDRLSAHCSCSCSCGCSWHRILLIKRSMRSRALPLRPSQLLPTHRPVRAQQLVGVEVECQERALALSVCKACRWSIMQGSNWVAGARLPRPAASRAIDHTRSLAPGRAVCPHPPPCAPRSPTHPSQRPAPAASSSPAACATTAPPASIAHLGTLCTSNPRRRPRTRR